MPKGHPRHKGYATQSSDLLEVWQRFGALRDANGTQLPLRLPGLTRPQARSLVTRLNYHRIRLQEAAHEGDELARQHFVWAQDAYIAISEDADKTFSVMLEESPLKRALRANKEEE
jgi:hypothetical protein